MRKISIAMMLIILGSLLVFGCVTPPQPEKSTGITNVTENTTTPPPVNKTETKPPAYLPLHLQYRFPTNIDQNGKESEILTMDYYWDRISDCSGKKALVGVAHAGFENEPSRSVWYKTTVYLDDGSSGLSKELGEGDLLFDGAKAQSQQINIPLMMSEWFVDGGKNFNSDPVWNESTPTIMKNISIFNNLGDVSIVKKGSKTVNNNQCTTFTVGTKGNNGPGSSVEICVIPQSSDMPLPFVASFGFSEGNGPHYTLTTIDHEKASVQYFPECISVVKCIVVTQPSSDEYQACNAKNGSIEPTNDDKNCVLNYACKTNTQKAIEDFKSSSAPSCPQPNQALIDKYSDCRWTKNHNWDFARDQKGCITDVICK